MPLYREFTDQIKAGIEAVGESFTTPDADWSPIAFVELRDGTVMPIILADGTTEAWAKLLAMGAKQDKWRKVALVVSAWAAHLRPGEVSPEGKAAALAGYYTAETRASTHPDRFEVVQLTVMDQERVEAWQARISRDGEHPPTLGEWEGFNEHGGATLGGVLVDDIRQALR